MPVEDLGHKKLLPIMDKKMKNHYQVPTIKVVIFKVEVGQQASVGSGTEPQQLGMEELPIQSNWYES